MEREKIVELVSKLTLEEKAGLTSGRDNWFTKAVERLGIPAVRMSDGPHGLRTQEGNINSLEETASVLAVCFPAACASAASFDRELLRKMGEELGEEANALGVDIILGPGVNMKRSPLCGRNFEYFSEDPYLAGELGTAFVQGVQSKGVGTSLKHFAANNQEHRRMDSSSEMDERTFREIYLPAFEKVVKEAQPWTVMASYNKIEGIYSTENAQLLTEILRKEWGFEGVVTSDWGATHDRVAAVEAGCDLTMPAEQTDDQIVQAVQEGRLSMEALDACCLRLLELAMRTAKKRVFHAEFHYEKGHELAREIAADSIVLLKNEDTVLPLKKEERVAFVGEFAENPRYQGGGSSHINSYKVTNAFTSARQNGFAVAYAKGYHKDGTTDELLLEEARRVAEAADKVVAFIGLTDAMESEGIDRRHMNLPPGHNRLIDALCEMNPNVIVVLHNGAPVEMPWVFKVKGILEVYLGGQAVGEAVADVLSGNVNPSGHLPESFPIRLEDNPSYLSYFGEGGVARYQEGLFVGYRYYESKKQEVLFPFGYGLSYTEFAYDNLKLERAEQGTLERDLPKSEITQGNEVKQGVEDTGLLELEESDCLKVSIDVTNIGTVSGKAIAQLYVAPEKAEMIRPVRELKAFEKISLAPQETKTVIFLLDARAFAHWNPVVHNWKIEDASYTIQIGLNAHEIVSEETIRIKAEPIPPLRGYTLGTPMGEFVNSIKGRKFLDDHIIYMIRGMMAAGFIPAEMGTLLDQIPGGVNLAALDMIAEKAGRGESGTSGLQALMGQPLGMLDQFLPEANKQELRNLMTELMNG